MKLIWLLLLFGFSLGTSAQSKKETKGLLPEVRLDSKDENENEERAMSSEILITRTENKAIESLQSILKKKKGSPDEANLWYRLAELYMRRSKSGRFFDLQINAKSKQLSLFPMASEKGRDSIKKAIDIYTRIERDFKKYREMDSVLFNNAFAHQQIGNVKEAQGLYEKTIERFPQSVLIPDSLVALGELYYDQRKFGAAVEYLSRLEKFPESRVYSYGMYKLAWTHYNMQDTKNGIKRLMQVVELSPLGSDGEFAKNRQNLRREALRDLTIFIGDTTPADELVMTFSKITKDDELGQAMTDLARLYDGHSRYKELVIFLTEFLKREPDNVYIGKARLFLVSASEALKQRDKVIEHLKITSQLCVTDSKWRLQHKKEIPDETCSHDFRITAKEIAEKWWEIWLKNKKHQEFTSLTEQSLKIIIDNEERDKPDLKSHYAYAELLFALERFDEASDQYKLVSEKMTEDLKLQHDASYAALFSKEKSIAKLGKERSPLKEGERKDLALSYVKRYPKGDQIPDVTMKLASIYYDEGNYGESQKWLSPIIAGQFGLALQNKGEDLQLDIYNLKKDYPAIQKLAKKIVAETKDSSRLANLTRILQEAAYTEIQDEVKSGDKNIAAEKLVQFSTEHRQSKLAPDALFQAVGIYFTAGTGVRGADAAVHFAQKYPADERSVDALKEAAKTYAEAGYLLKAAETLKILAASEKKDPNPSLELAADFYSLEKQDKQARQIYTGLLNSSDPKVKSRIFSKILTTYPEKSGPEYAKLQNNILSMNIEPYATQILIDRLMVLIDSKKNSDAFELAKKIVGRETTPLLRAKARLVQAKILEDELVRQSLKSTQADRFAMILAMKTEKLDKAQTAYLNASRMVSDPQIQLEALSGVDRCYANYVDSLKNTQLPASLTAEDQNTLRNEMSKIVGQIDGKRKENSQALLKLAKIKMVVKQRNWNTEEVSVDQTLPPLVHYPASKVLLPYLPANSEMIFNKLKRIEGRTNTACGSKPLQSDFKFHEAFATCHSNHDIKEMEKIAYSLIDTKENKLIGLYYLSLVAELQGAWEKSLYFTELALKSQNDAPLLMYQKARMVYQIEDLPSALPFFDKVLDMQMSSTETETFLGIKSFIENDFETVIVKFSNLSTDKLYNLNIGTLLAESYAQKGQVDRAVKLVNDLLAKGSGTLDLMLEKARILETYKLAPLLALEAYEKAVSLAKEEELRNWLERKIDLLKNQNKSRAAR